jgi:DNA end-binding protein Ku
MPGRCLRRGWPRWWRADEAAGKSSFASSPSHSEHIVSLKTADFEPEKFEDHYEEALTELINAKRIGKTIAAKPRPRGENVVDLMDGLRRSIGGAEPARASKPSKKPRKNGGQKEMLMPIEGKRVAKGAAAKKPASKSQRKSA